MTFYGVAVAQKGMLQCKPLTRKRFWFVPGRMLIPAIPFAFPLPLAAPEYRDSPKNPFKATTTPAH